MMKNILLLVICAGLLASCNLPQGPGAPTPTQQAPEDFIATAVAATLTPAEAVKTTLVSEITATLEEVQISPTPSSTLTPEATLTPSATPTLENTVTPSATSTPDDITNGLGTAAFKDTFDSSNGFFQKGVNSAEDDYTKFSIGDGKMTMKSFGTPYWLGWRLTYPTVENFYLEATFTTHACSGLDYYGLVMRAPNYDSGYGYYLAFACNGSFRFARWDDNGNVGLTDWVSSPFILAGSDQTNRLGVWASGGSFKLYANGKLLQEITDGNISDSGHFGCFIAYANTNNFTVDMDNLTYWNVP